MRLALPGRAVLAQRNALLDQVRREDAVQYLDGVWKDDPSGGLKALLVGIQDARKGARRSIGTDMASMTDQMVGGVTADVAKIDPADLKLFASGLEDADVVRVLWALSNGDKTDSLPDVAVQIGQAVRK